MKTHDVTPEAIAKRKEAKKVKEKRTIIWIVVVIAAILFIGPCLPGGGIGRNSSVAWEECKKHVEARLKVPASAEFPWLDDGYVTVWGEDSDEMPLFVIKAHVDSQNALGTEIRTNWVCKVRYKEDEERWVLKELRLD